MKEKAKMKDTTCRKMGKDFHKLLELIRATWPSLRRKISNVRKRLNAALSSETARSLISLAMLIATISVVIVAFEHREAANEQLRIAKERQQWLREDRERRADIYLETTRVETLETNEVKLTFTLINIGDDIAEKV